MVKIDGPARQIFTVAADIVDKGWRRAAFGRDVDGCPVLPKDARAVTHSATGAMSKARFDMGLHPMAQRLAEDMLRREVGFNPRYWNNAVAKDAAEVSAALRAAAKGERLNQRIVG